MNRLDRLVRLTLPLLLIGVLCACGKEGPPVPRDQHNMFAWGEATADFAGYCLVFAGQLNGAYENANIFALELEAGTDDICLNCPFRPDEFLELTPDSAEEGLFIFQYCPTTMADTYRWRLIAQNALQSLPHAVSPVKIVRRPLPGTRSATP
ncbi:MAG: hypothetical protein LBC10_04640 [Deltaproteobacteria bacterium]|nr:hypothetical protein [Deltaproteobacteria bacterium]